MNEVESLAGPQEPFLTITMRGLKLVRFGHMTLHESFNRITRQGTDASEEGGKVSQRMDNEDFTEPLDAPTTDQRGGQSKNHSSRG